MADKQLIFDVKVDDNELKTLVGDFDKLSASIREVEVEIKDLQKLNKSYEKSIKDIEAAQKNGTKTNEQAVKEIEDLNRKIIENNKIIAISKNDLRGLNSERNTSIKLMSTEANSLRKLEALSAKLNQAISNTNTKTKEGIKRYQELQKELKGVNAEINKQRQAFNDNTKNIGNYTQSINKANTGLKGMGKALGGMLSMFGATAGISAFFSIIKNGISTFAEFEKAVSNLGAITQGSKTDIEALTAQAKMLGATTASTATEVIGLQTELAKLGFTTAEILNATEGVQSLALATKTDLADAAALAGATLRSFGLDAKEMTRVTDVLAISTTKSALDMTKLGEAMPYAATSAKIAGDSVETLAAKMGVLADSGMGASTIGTSLRDIYSDLAQKGLTWDEAMQKIATSTDKTKTAFQLFGKTSMNAAIILSENSEKVQKLDKDLQKMSVTAKDMAAQQLDNLAGDVTLLTSAYDGFIMSLEDGNGEINKTLRGFVQFGTEMLNSLSAGNALTQTYQKLFDAIGDLVAPFIKIAELLGITTDKASAVDIIFGILSVTMKIAFAPLRLLMFGIDGLANGFAFVIEGIKSFVKSSPILFNQVLAIANVFGVVKDAIVSVLETLGVLEKTPSKKIQSTFDEMMSLTGGGKKTDTATTTTKKTTQLEQIELLNEIKSKPIGRPAPKMEIPEPEVKRDPIGDIESIQGKGLGIETIDNELVISMPVAINTNAAIEQMQFLKESIAENLSEINEIAMSFGGGISSFFASISDGFFNIAEKGKATSEDWLNSTSMVAEGAMAFITDRITNSLSDIETARNSELELAGDNEEAKLAINKKYDDERKKIQLKQFNAEKANAILQIGIETAKGVIKAVAQSPLTFGLPWSAVVGGIGLTQAAIVAAKQPPQFAQGTSDIVSIGGSHSSGNDVDVWGFAGSQKQYFGKVEAGEAMPVIKKGSYDQYIAAKLNGHFGGRGGHYATGTTDIVQPQQQQQQQAQQLTASDLANAMKNINIVAKIEDITKESGKKMEIINNAKF